MDLYESADTRARELLRRVLPERQWAQFSETGVLDVPGSRGTYRICAGDLTRLFNSQTRQPFANLCLQLMVPAPVYDRILAEYLLIRNDEDLYWQTANVFFTGMDDRAFAECLVALLDITLFTVFLVQLV
jgi:hypothetical protein